jgi:hypothetical protein
MPFTVEIQTPSHRIGHDESDKPWTPYDRKLNPRDPTKPSQNTLSPTSRTISQQSSRMHRAEVIATHGFFSPQRRLIAGSQSVRNAARALDADSRIRRLDGDVLYRDDMIKLVCYISPVSEFAEL